MRDRIVLTVGPDESESNNLRFGEILKYLRMNAQLSKPQAAQHIGVSPEYVRLIEKGERTPALGTVLQILEVYEVPYARDKSQLLFEEIEVTFTSRIKETRHHIPKLTRNETIGQIVSYLVIADDDTLKKVHKILN